MTIRKRRIALAFAYTLLVIGGVSLTDFAQSHAYFTTNNKDNPLKYQANVVNNYEKFKLGLDSDSAKLKNKVPFIFSFDINDGVSTKYADEYEVNVPTGCSVTSIVGSGASSENKNSIILPIQDNSTNTTYREGKLTVRMTCNITIGENRKFDVSVTEKTKGHTGFTYAEVDKTNLSSNWYDFNYEAYKPYIVDKVDSPYGPVTGTDVKDIYAEFKYWIENYSQQKYSGLSSDGQTSKSEKIKNYVTHSEEGIIKDSSDFAKLLASADANGYDNTTIFGINIKSNGNGSYTFAVEDNLLGYAETYYSYKNADPNDQGFVFHFDTTNKQSSKDDKTVINEAFDVYLNNYIYKGQTDYITKVKNYIASQSDDGQISGFVVDGNIIPGFSEAYNDNNVKISYFILKSDVDKYMNTTYPIRIDINEVENSKKAFYMNIFNMKQFRNDPIGKIMSDVLKNSDKDENNFFYNSMVSQYSPDLQYFLKYNDEGYYILYTAWSNSNYNNVKADKFTLPSGYNLDSFQVVYDGVNTYLETIISHNGEIENIDNAGIYSNECVVKLVEMLGMNPSKYEFDIYPVDGDKSKIILDINQEVLLKYLNNDTVYNPLIEYSIPTQLLKASVTKPSINSDPAIPPLEVGASSNQEETDTPAVVDTETSCKDGETGKDQTPIVDDPDESSDEEESTEEPAEESTEESTEDKINQANQDTANYPSNNVSDNPNKDEDTESTELDQLPKIK